MYCAVCLHSAGPLQQNMSMLASVPFVLILKWLSLNRTMPCVEYPRLMVVGSPTMVKPHSRQVVIKNLTILISLEIGFRFAQSKALMSISCPIILSSFQLRISSI